MKNIIKHISTHIILGCLTLCVLGIGYAAWNDVVNSGDPLTASGWNDLVNKVAELDNFSFSNGNIGIGITPEQKLHVDGNIQITNNGESVVIDVDTWNDIQDFVTKKAYRFWTWNSTDSTHYWYGPGTNFRNCEVLDYFQQGSSIQNTLILTILVHNMGSDRTTWSSSPYHGMFLRDFNLSSSHNNPSSSTYGAWSTVKYGPSFLERCVAD
ncbi:hypothetical protein MK079_00700 [Candidatus Gracilibacteria bacterium]|nr:hypothetical protein [Candidatus Gracilibacteria bacterium]